MTKRNRKRVTTRPYCRWTWTAEQRLAHYTRRDPVSGCLIWQASLAPGGYGQLTFQSRGYLAHRFAWIAKHGPIPPGLHVCHRCDERRCVNPDHLFLGNHSANMLDLRTKTRRWYDAPASETKSPTKLDTGLAPIRIRYRGIEFFGKVGIRFVEPGVGFPTPQSPGRSSGSRRKGVTPARRPTSSHRRRSGHARAGGA